MWHCDIANVKKIDYGTLTPSLLSLSLVRKLCFCDAHKFQGPIPHAVTSERQPINSTKMSQVRPKTSRKRLPQYKRFGPLYRAKVL